MTITIRLKRREQTSLSDLQAGVQWGYELRIIPKGGVGGSKKIRRGNTRLAVEAERAVSLGADGELGLDSTHTRKTLLPQSKTRSL